MEISKLIGHFVSNSSDFYSDLDVIEIDRKHDDIVRAAYEQFSSGSINSIRELRSWNKQTDMSVPAQLSMSYLRLYGIGIGLLRYIYLKTFRRNDEVLQRQQIVDDIRIIQLAGGGNLLKDNAVHLTPGVGPAFNYEDLSVNPRWLRYIYLVNTIIMKKLLPENGVWVDVGSYYGGMQGLVRKYFPKTRIVMVDFHHQLCRSYVYLKTMYPDAEHILPNSVDEGINLASLAPGSFIYVPVSRFDKISTQRVNLVSNFFSLGEMRRISFENYMKSQLFETAESVYLVNRFVSSPFFEKTYDTDLNVYDYIMPNMNLAYFDVFPIHHYNLISRILLGSERHRNTSSSYFELIYSRAEAS